MFRNWPVLLSSRIIESCSGSNEDGCFLDCTSINTSFLDGTLLDTEDDDRADGGCSTMRSVSFQSFDDDGGNSNGAFDGNDANSSNNSDDNASGSILSD